jgi:hypothetical protein
MINLIKVALILMVSISALAENTLQVRWQENTGDENKIDHIKFVLSTDKPIYGVQIDGAISKDWLEGIETGKSLYIPLSDGGFFGEEKSSTISQHANKLTGSFSFVTSLIRPAIAVENNAVIFTLPVKPAVNTLADLSFENVKVGYQDGSTEIINDIEIDPLLMGEKSNRLDLNIIVIGMIIILMTLLLFFVRKLKAIKAITA